MAVYTTINDPSVYFQTQLYTGNASTLNVVNGGNANLQPDWVWLKNYGTAGKDYGIFDSTRGTTKTLSSNNTSAESTNASTLTAFNSDGFTLGSDGGPNANSSSNVAWQWKANGGTTVTNTAGTYNTTVQANTTAGFSIVKFNAPFDQGNGRYNLGHGLGATPEFIITKCTGASADWYVYHKDMGGSNIYLRLNLTNATSTTGARYTFYEPTFSSTVFNMDWNNILQQNQDFICYCFVGVQGYSKFGKYTGNGNADGPFIYTGFKPGFVMIKRIDNAGNWTVFNNKSSSSNGSNLIDYSLDVNSNNAQETGGDGSVNDVDFLSNGIKIRATNGDLNASGNSVLYMAFAASPFVTSDGVPTTAR